MVQGSGIYRSKYFNRFDKEFFLGLVISRNGDIERRVDNRPNSINLKSRLMAQNLK